MSKYNELEIRIPYADTDQMGVVYYGNYYVYFERGRTEWLRDRGMCYRDLEKQGLYLPVVECKANYSSPVNYDDLIIIKTSLNKIGKASMEFVYEIVKNKKVVTTGNTKHTLVNNKFRPVRIPDQLRKKLENG